MGEPIKKTFFKPARINYYYLGAGVECEIEINGLYKNIEPLMARNYDVYATHIPSFLLSNACIEQALMISGLD
jgi:hypothetical protein